MCHEFPGYRKLISDTWQYDGCGTGRNIQEVVMLRVKLEENNKSLIYHLSCVGIH